MYGRPSGNVWSWIGPDGDQSLPGMLFDDVSETTGKSLEEAVCDVMIEANLACGFRGAPPHSTRVWRQIEEDVMELPGAAGLHDRL